MAKRDKKPVQSLAVYFFDKRTGEPSQTTGFAAGSKKDVDVWVQNAERLAKATPIGKAILLVRRDVGSAGQVRKPASLRKPVN